MTNSSPRRYVLLPDEGVGAREGAGQQMLSALPFVRSTEPPEEAALAQVAASVRVVDTATEDGPRLVEIDDETAAALNRDAPVRAFPEVHYRPPDPRLRPLAGATAALAAGAAAPSIKCLDARSGAGVQGVHVVAFTNFATREGAEGISDASGDITLRLQSTSIERLYAYSPAGYWGAFLQSLSAASTITLQLEPVDLTYTDCVRHYYGSSRFDASTGVQVGVIDSGAGPHSLLNIASGRNTVTGEPAQDFVDGGHHGTHVCGLIGADGAPPAGLRGLAPGVPIHIYRVFPPDDGATNYAILKALIFAAADGCDIVNLSLGGGPYDPIVEEGIRDARNQGMLVVIAAGNDGRKKVSYPASYAGATAISAMGREGTFPAGSLDEGDVLRPPASGVDPAEFIAGFSNVGPEVAATGPGVGALSTLPNDGYGPLSGTSMAAPVVAGAAACLLSREPSVYGMVRDAARASAIEKLLQSHCVLRKFGLVYEGFGLPDPTAV